MVQLGLEEVAMIDGWGSLNLVWEMEEGAAASAEAGIVPEPVAAMIEGSACCRSH